MMDGLHIFFYRDSSAETILAEDLQRLDDEGRRAMGADLNWASMSLIVEGRERLGDRPSLGPLQFMAPQLEAAADRLRNGEIALVRSGVLDQEPGLYLLFEPATEGTTTISLLAIYEMSMLFPVPPESAESRMIYDYVREHRNECIAEARKWYDLTEVPVSSLMLIEALKRESTVARALLAMQ
jgi:hypothetical protein